MRVTGRTTKMCEMCEQLRIILGLSDDQLEDMAKAKMMRTMERGGIKSY